jgi:hypothetical protein
MRRSRLLFLLLALGLGVYGLFLALDRGPIRASRAPEAAPHAPAEPESPRIEAAESAAQRGRSDPTEPDPGAPSEEAAVRTLSSNRYGSSVSGRVQWPDGRAPTGCTIQVETQIPSPSGEGWISIESTHADVLCKEDGSFDLGVSERLSVSLTARTASPPGCARLRGVEPGTTGIVLVLEPAWNVSGSAVDDRGDPLTAFKVTARALEEPRDSLSLPSEGGRFALCGLQSGTWVIVAESPGHSTSTAHRIVVPADLEPVTLVLPRCAAVSGRVRLPTGEIAPRARIRSWVPDSPSLDSFEEDRSGTRTNAEGEFVLENLDAGPQRIVASKEGLADSEPLAVELRPGEVVRDLDLRLQLGGRIVGEVLDAFGQPLPGLTISLFTQGSGAHLDAEADFEGRFEFDALAPGKYRLMAIPSPDELEELQRSGDTSGRAKKAFERTAAAEVLEGQTTHVTIGGAVQGGIRVHGVVSMGGLRSRPASEVQIEVRREDDEITPARTGSTDDQGQYEIFVERDGIYLLTVSDPNASFFLDRLRVPPGKEFEHDITLPSGFVSGRILLQDGSPAQGVSVMLQPEESTAELSSSMSVGFLETDGSGAFAFDGLKEGFYRIEAGQLAGPDPSPGKGTAVLARLILAESQRIEGLELRLQAPARLEGLVTDQDGKPCPGAVVFVRDETGSLIVRSYPPPTSDASGRFTIGGLSPCTVTVGARTKKLVVVEAPCLTLRSGETARVSLALHPGTVLRVLVQEHTGKPVGALIRVTHERGQQVGAAYPYGVDEAGEPFSPDSGVRIGPIPPGRYTVTATNHDRTSTSREISVSGDEQVVTLKFGG